MALTRPRHHRLAGANEVESMECIAIAAFRKNSRLCLYGTSRRDYLPSVNFDVLLIYIAIRSIFICVASAAQLNEYCCPSECSSVRVSEVSNAGVKTLITR